MPLMNRAVIMPSMIDSSQVKLPHRPINVEDLEDGLSFANAEPLRNKCHYNTIFYTCAHTLPHPTFPRVSHIPACPGVPAGQIRCANFATIAKRFAVNSPCQSCIKKNKDLEETIFVDVKMEQSTFLPPRYIPPEDEKRMTDEKPIKEIFDRQTRNLERSKIQSQNASPAPSERPKSVEEKMGYSKADKFDYQITSQHNSTIAPSEKVIFADIKSTIDEIYPRLEDRPSLTLSNVRNQVEQKLGLEEGFFAQDVGKEKWKNLIKSYAVESVSKDEEEEELDALLAQIKKSEFRLIKESRKTSVAAERQLVNSKPTTTTKPHPTTMIPAGVSIPELSKIKQTHFKIFDGEAPKQKTVETNRAIHFALKKMGLSDLAGIDGVSIDPKNGEVTLETESEFDLKLVAEDRKWLGARNGSLSPPRDNMAKKIKKSTTISSYELKHPISQKKWKVVSGAHAAVTEDSAAIPAGMIYKVQEAAGAEKSPSTRHADNAIVRDPVVICAEMIQKVKEAKAKIANESDAKKAENAELMAIRELERQEALKMADIQERRAEGVIARMELRPEEARVLREEAEAAAFEAYNETHASDKKPEPKVKTAPSSLNDYFDHTSRRERTNSMRTSQPLSRVSVPLRVMPWLKAHLPFMESHAM